MFQNLNGGIQICFSIISGKIPKVDSILQDHPTSFTLKRSEQIYESGL